MHWFRWASWLRASLVMAFLIGCEGQPAPQRVVAPPQQQVAEPPVLDPVHLGEDRLRSPLLENLRQQIENSETDETREVTQPLKDRRIVWKSPADGSLLAVREGNWKAVRIASAKFQLFDLNSDRAEQWDVAAEHDDVLQRLIKN